MGSDLHRACGHTATQSFPQWVRVSADSQRMRECICHSAFTRSAPFPSALIPFFLSRALGPWLPYHLLATRHFSAINTRIAQRKKWNLINQLWKCTSYNKNIHSTSNSNKQRQIKKTVHAKKEINLLTFIYYLNLYDFLFSFETQKMIFQKKLIKNACPYNESQWASMLFCTPLAFTEWTKTALQNLFYVSQKKLIQVWNYHRFLIFGWICHFAKALIGVSSK